LRYVVSDGTASTAATLALELGAVNDVPELTGEQPTLAQGAEDTAYTVSLAQLLQGFADVDGERLAVTELTLDHGTAVQNADGSWTLTLEENYHGPLTLAYGVSDGTDTTPATLALEVGAVNDAPVLSTEPALLPWASEDTAYTVSLEQLLQGFTDVDGDILSVTQLTLEHGTAAQNEDGSWTLTLEHNYHGPLTLSYAVSDGSTSTAATLALEVGAVDDAPELSGEPATLRAAVEDTVYTVTQAQLLQGFTDVDSAELWAVELTLDHGWAAQNEDGSWSITLEPDYHGPVTLSYLVADGEVATPATLALEVGAANDAPVLGTEPAWLEPGAEDSAYTVSLEQLLQGFADVDGDRLSVTALTVDHGSAAQNADGSWTITPEADYHGVLVLSYEVSDGVQSVPAALGLELVPVNDAMVLSGEQAVLEPGAEDAPYTVSLEQLLQGFTDIDGDALFVSELTLEHGTAAQNWWDGSWSITPEANYHGPLTLRYVVSDGTASTAATLALELGAVNDVPELTGEQPTLAQGAEDTAYTVSLAQLLQGFTDVDGERLSVTELTADHGTAVQNADGSWTITPVADYHGPLTLAYGVSDGTDTTAATLALEVGAVNDAPVLSAEQALPTPGGEDTAYTVSLEQLLQGFTDVDGDQLWVTALTVDHDHGTAVQNEDGSWTITPVANYHGVLTLVYGVSDGTVTTPATLALELVAVNDLPELSGTAAALPAAVEDAPYTVTQAQLLQGFTDVEGAALWAVDLTLDHGWAAQSEDGSWSITLEPDYHGPVTLSYGVSDGIDTTAATLALQVGAANDAPVLSAGPAWLEPGAEDLPYTVSLEQLLQGFADVDGDRLSVTALTVDHGSAAQNADGSWRITPEADYHGVLVLSYEVSDGVQSVAATLGLELVPVNDAMVLSGEQAVLEPGAEDLPYTVSLEQLLQGFTDVDGDALFVSELSVDHGTAAQNWWDGSWSITPEADYHGPLALSYVVGDGVASTTATLALELGAVNDAPVLGGEPAVLEPGTQDAAYTVSLEQLLQGVTDADGDTLAVSGLSADHGTAAQNADGSWSITPEAGYSGALTLSYGVSDGTDVTELTLGTELAPNPHPELF
ncbi:cadherin-like domain-containing protein, partial [Azohydromonas caseinilytica]